MTLSPLDTLEALAEEYARKPGRGCPVGRQKADPATLTPLARALHAVRTKSGVTQIGLAVELGVSPALIANAETARVAGRGFLSTDSIVRAAEVLGCAAAPLLAARDRSRASFPLPNLSEAHAEAAIALRDAWARLDAETLARIVAIVGGGQ